ncbi:hypothetical protein D3C71_1911020 [compost metagenome]
MLELLQFLVVSRAHESFCDAGGQARFCVDEGLYRWKSSAFKFAVTLLEQALAFALRQLRQCLAQAARTTFEAR